MHIEHGNPPPLELSRETWRRVFAAVAMHAQMSSLQIMVAINELSEKAGSSDVQGTLARACVYYADALLARLEATAEDKPHA